MLTSKQRSYLRRMANQIDSILQIGKGGINANLIKQLDDALEARELIKVHVLQNAEMDIKDIFKELARELSAQEVQLIGSRFVLYRKSMKNPRIELPY
ncbi:MAG: ribosome assembly RNA-binding protein YhbY [Clostridiales bacterium]|jgi:RNA-binding protein|nr:ribosome assembly RNA-binding protein YhbY [Clostridiales bacterium]